MEFMKKKIALLITTMALVGGVLSDVEEKNIQSLMAKQRTYRVLFLNRNSNVGEIHNNSDSDFYVTIAKVSKEDYQNYFDSCKEEFSIEVPSALIHIVMGIIKMI